MLRLDCLQQDLDTACSLMPMRLNHHLSAILTLLRPHR
jgi:hypothetical protein